MRYEFTVECADHGEMIRDEPTYHYRCKDSNCSRSISDHDLRRLLYRPKNFVARSADKTIPIIVT